MYVKQNKGAVQITHCWGNDDANTKIEALLHNITVAVGSGAPLPKHQEIWAIGFELEGKVRDELSCFARFSTERREIRCSSSPYLFFNVLRSPNMIDNPISLQAFLLDIYAATEYKVNNDFVLLYNLLPQEDFETLIANILYDRPDRRFIPREDYILDMFLKRERKRSDLPL